ncbi:MAG: bifunctional glutamate N-acetyltransferase/amino-acid acetyltransferase ArgJ [Planctomycetes bacterium]|nr:bifunctional glutamate N-acetyltransferase/amino-acid acetyltransferase ArgJ [Planctomycetota bacterium]
MSLPIAQGFQFAGVYCGIKRNTSKLDCSLVLSDRPAVAVGVYTRNLVFAAPVGLDRSRTPSDKMRGVVINSGNANACTGERGARDAERMAELAGSICGVQPTEMLVMSTGVIGEFLPMEKIAAGINLCANQLAGNEDALVAAARGMLTTDTRHKIGSRQVKLGNRTVTITGMAKGAAMIGPNMATMLGLLLTDAPLATASAQSALKEAVHDSFNSISVDGHMSTNDTVLLLANGAAGGAPLAGDELAGFQAALNELSAELARAIPADGEGATHLITIEIIGCADRAAAHRIAKTVAESPLVKTAITGADPNWGRIVSAAGYAGVPFDPNQVTLHLNGELLYEHGSPVAFDETAVSKTIKENRDVSIVLRFGEGSGKARFWTTDLTAEYVHLNADYHT